MEVTPIEQALIGRKQKLAQCACQGLSVKAIPPAAMVRIGPAKGDLVRW
jgi:hypothetical protein